VAAARLKSSLKLSDASGTSEGYGARAGYEALEWSVDDDDELEAVEAAVGNSLAQGCLALAAAVDDSGAE